MDTQRANQPLLFGEAFSLTVTLDLAAGAFRFEWLRDATTEVVATACLRPVEATLLRTRVLQLDIKMAGNESHDGCNASPASTRAFMKRVRKLFPVAEGGLRIGLLADKDLGAAQAGRWLPLAMPRGLDAWTWLQREVQAFAKLVDASFNKGHTSPHLGRAVLYLMACALLEVAPSTSEIGPGYNLLDLQVTFDQVQFLIEFAWSQSGQPAATGRVRPTGSNQLTWEVETRGHREPTASSRDRASIRGVLEGWLKQFPTNRGNIRVFWVQLDRSTGKPLREEEPLSMPPEHFYGYLEDNIVGMAEAARDDLPPLPWPMNVPLGISGFDSYFQRYERKAQKLLEEEARRQENMTRLAEERRQRELRRSAERKAADAKRQAEARTHSGDSEAAVKKRAPLPPLAVRFEMPPLAFQDTAFPLPDLKSFLLCERAGLWWVSNQSDDLLCLPHCRIERLEYQIRTALRALGPLRGRALLSDEVGLGKTIEAGLVMKELLTRGMVKNFLVLTVPSLVDQWEEELSEKFGLSTVTTNQSLARANPRKFWCENASIVASLHTLKQPAQLEVARQVKWDILVVDEAHYLRNRNSQAWQAVNALPRQYLLLLTATPVQNSLEELYNLVTLLQPGQLPAPKEFRARFLDPKRPRQPREPEELRRVLGQIMIRNTRANAGLKLPPRRAETVLFEAGEGEREFWQQWESELRGQLSRLSASQANLWGRLLLQTAGSSPAAWRGALEKFPNAEAARAWREQAPLESSWRRKCDLIPPVARGEGGAVIFTQFLQTQTALADFLRDSGVETFVMNGSTPPAERQPITEKFRERGGALLLTQSGTEGRNLQFCHRLVNFDLPWNPMEIEQRIGRLHRLGQQHPVRIHNFVQTGTLQEHLLEILQEKLNLFELVVGETGLVLGERFSSDEFAEEVLRRWRENEGRVAEALAGLGEELALARDAYNEVKKLDETLFARAYESM
jgi:superfamily II DNA or RNA helicase